VPSFFQGPENGQCLKRVGEGFLGQEGGQKVGQKIRRVHDTYISRAPFYPVANQIHPGFLPTWKEGNLTLHHRQKLQLLGLGQQAQFLGILLGLFFFKDLTGFGPIGLNVGSPLKTLK